MKSKVGQLSIVAVCMVLSGCLNPGLVDASAGHKVDESSFSRSWRKDASSTTCGEYSSSMNDQQRYESAFGILSDLRIDDGFGSEPTQEDAREFSSHLVDRCASSPGQSVLDAAEQLYDGPDPWYDGE